MHVLLSLHRAIALIDYLPPSLFPLVNQPKSIEIQGEDS